MFVDQTSLLLALGFSTFALSMTLFVTWLSTRTEWFLLIWATGAGMLVVAFAGFSVYAMNSNYLLLWTANILLSSGLGLFYGSACLFTDRVLPRHRLVILTGATVTCLSIPFLLGFDALGAIVGNLINTLLMVLTAAKFWAGRHEARTWMTAISSLYGLTGLSFIPCAVVIYLKGPLILAAPPSGWAEDVNAIVGLIGLTGIGALSLALNQARAAHQHRDEANTDILSGLLNRRAVFERFGSGPLAADTALLLFDLDHFKSINDRHGHAVGDETLKRFAQILRQNTSASASAARLGGEEFLIILNETNADEALEVAELVRAGFACELMQGSDGAFHGTVSSGVSIADGADTFDETLSRADQALYNAKGNGRNQVALVCASIA